MRGRSLAGPLILIGVGALLLLRNFIPEFHVMAFLRDWWPALLILIGLGQLIDRLGKPGDVR